MIIKPSTAIRNDYNAISDLCREKGEPVYLTKNGEGDLVVLNIDAYEKEKKMLALKAKLLEAESARLSGEKTYTLDEMRKAVLNG